MKVLHVIDSGGLYGAEVMLLNLMQEQRSLGLEPQLASIGDSGCPPKELEIEARRRGFPVREFRMAPGPNLLGALDLVRYAKSLGVDLFHSHGYKGNILLGFLPRMIRRLPMVTTVHGWTTTGGTSRMRLYEWLDGVSFSRLDRVVLVNPVMKEHPRLRKRASIAFEVVTNGIGPVSPGPATGTLDPIIVDFCREGFIIGALGRLSPEKGFDLLVAAVARLVRDGKDLRLVILGEGGQRGRLEEMVKALGLDGRVLLPGFVPNARDYLSLFNLFAMPSLTEGLPMALLEAMQSEVAVVASAVGGIPGLLKGGSAGLLVESGSVPALQGALAEVLDNPPAARQRVETAASIVAEEYSSRTMAERYVAIYRDVLSDRKKEAFESVPEPTEPRAKCSR